VVVMVVKAVVVVVRNRNEDGQYISEGERKGRRAKPDEATMSGLARTALSRQLIAWLSDPEELRWVKDNPEADRFRYYVRWWSWMRVKAIREDSILQEDRVTLNGIIRTWALNLPNWLRCLDMALVAILEKNLSFQTGIGLPGD